MNRCVKACGNKFLFFYQVLRPNTTECAVIVMFVYFHITYITVVIIYKENFLSDFKVKTAYVRNHED